VISNCSNNYGPWQFPEKLIPLTTLKAMARQELPVYGAGENVRDWLFVDDHVTALMAVLEHGKIGESYNIGGDAERRNIDVVHELCALLDDMMADSGPARSDMVRFVADRPGHDFRYAMDISKIKNELGWQPKYGFQSGLRKTVEWYLENQAWCRKIKTYRGERLGAAVVTETHK
jgi:dTDP-glucose 4,6-dehydratase